MSQECGKQTHADCNAGRNIGRRRASPIGSVFQRKDVVLGEVVLAFTERQIPALHPGRSGARGDPADPREDNPYFGGVRPVVARSFGRRKTIRKSVKVSPLVASCFDLIVLFDLPSDPLGECAPPSPNDMRVQDEQSDRCQHDPKLQSEIRAVFDSARIRAGVDMIRRFTTDATASPHTRATIGIPRTCG